MIRDVCCYLQAEMASTKSKSVKSGLDADLAGLQTVPEHPAQ